MNRAEIEKQFKKYGTTMEAMEKEAKYMGVNVDFYISMWLEMEQGFEEYGEDYWRIIHVEDLDALEQ